MARDRIYRRQMNSVAPFAFDENVARVFDDMVSRSIPHYAETQRITAELIRWKARAGDTIVDVGASTGALLEALAPLMRTHRLKLRLIDSARPMLDAAEARAETLGVSSRVESVCADVRQIGFREEPIVVLNYVLQFLPPGDRRPLMARIRESVGERGLVIVSEKVCADDQSLQPLLDEFYYAFKRQNGYSLAEIEQKRQALEGVLVARSAQWNEEMLRSAGFAAVQRVLAWMPFVTWVASP